MRDYTRREVGYTPAPSDHKTHQQCLKFSIPQYVRYANLLHFSLCRYIDTKIYYHEFVRMLSLAELNSQATPSLQH